MIASLYTFIIRGNYPVYKNQKIKHSLVIVVIGFVIHFLFALQNNLLIRLSLVEPKAHPASIRIDGANTIIELSMLFMTIVMIHPLIEELSFRLIIGSKGKTLKLGLSFMITLLILLLTRFYKNIPFNEEIMYVFLFIVISFIFLILNNIVEKTLKIDFNNIFNKNVYLIVVLTSILFGIAHINVINNPSTTILYPILILPYILKGFLFAYARLSLGFVFAFFCHATNNFFIFLINLM